MYIYVYLHLDNFYNLNGFSVFKSIESHEILIKMSKQTDL